MFIAGLDLSMNSSGVTKFELDKNLNLVEVKYIGFTTTKKLESANIFHYKKDQFKDELEKNLWFNNHIKNFVECCDYVALEGYSYGSFGINFEIGEFCGLIKHDLYDCGMKLRVYDINTIKLFGAEKGNADKLDMYEAFVKNKYLKLDERLPIPVEKTRKKGVSPTSDIVDSFHICNLLLMELKLRKGLIELKNLKEEMIKVFNRTTKAHPTNILATNFLYRGEQ